MRHHCRNVLLGGPLSVGWLAVEEGVAGGRVRGSAPGCRGEENRYWSLPAVVFSPALSHGTWQGIPSICFVKEDH